MWALTEWLQPLAPNAFFKDVWSAKAAISEPAAAARPNFGIEDLEALIRHAKLRFPHVTCLDSDGTISPLKYTASSSETFDPLIDADSVFEMAASGKTVRVMHLADLHSETRRLAQRLKEVFACPVHVNAYYSRGPTRGVPGHYDTHHVFALQAKGTKVWRLGPIIVDSAHPEYKPKPLVTPPFTRRVEVGEGQMVYVPPGMWHATETTDYSLHLTIGIHPLDWAEAIRAMVDDGVTAWPILRSHRPFKLENDKCVYPAPAKADIEGLLTILTRRPESANKPATAAPEHPGHNGLPRTRQEEPDTEGPTPLLMHAARELWNAARDAVAIYLRGSFTSSIQAGEPEPWDVDLVLIQKGGFVKPDAQQLADSLTAKYPALPPIDLWMLTEAQLGDVRHYPAAKLLLLEMGRLLLGTPIKHQIRTIGPTPELAQELRAHIWRRIDKRIALLEFAVKQHGVLSPETVRLRRSIAKEALRSATAWTLEFEGRLCRDPRDCVKVLINVSPEFAEQIGILEAALDWDCTVDNETLCSVAKAVAARALASPRHSDLIASEVEQQQEPVSSSCDAANGSVGRYPG